MCPCCKNEDTQRITEAYDLAPFSQHYGIRPFVALSCFACGASFSFERTSEGDAREALRKAILHGSASNAVTMPAMQAATVLMA